MTEIDILKIDKDIHDKFQAEKDNIKKYKEKLLELETYTEIKDLDCRVYDSLINKQNELKEYIIEIETDTKLNFYIAESLEILIKYKNFLDTPMKLSFTGKKMKNNKEKTAVINEYILIANKYIDIELPSALIQPKSKIICDNCKNTKEFDIVENNTYVCLQCSAQKSVIKHTSSFNDIDRINISSKYCYDRKIHFRDCINQFQGKQNCTIQSHVYEDLEIQFKNHYLLVEGTDITKEEKYKHITKEVIMIFLKDLNYTKHYENVNLIHYVITGIKPDDIGYLEDKLMRDFDILTDLYDQKYKEIVLMYGYDDHLRKNFINTAYVLFQLLNKYKHPCKKEDFSMLKTVDRINFHDIIIKYLFEHLHWNYSPYF